MDFQILSWPMLLLALLVFGFAPGLLLRLIVLAFPKDDPRRGELRGELYNVPRFERPFWVVEQMEVALFEGLRGRLVQRGNRVDDAKLLAAAAAVSTAANTGGGGRVILGKRTSTCLGAPGEKCPLCGNVNNFDDDG